MVVRRQWAAALPLALALAVVPAGSSGPGPALVLGQAQEAAVAALRPPEFSRRGDPLAFVESPHDLVGTLLPCDEVAAHLGIPLPAFRDLSERGFTRFCGAREGRGVLAHPVPSVAHPSPPSEDPAADQHAVTLVWLPPGVDVDADFDTARARGLVWTTFQYGGLAAAPVTAADVDRTPQDDYTVLTWPDGGPLGVQWMDRADTRLAWPSETADHRFWVSVNVPGSPVQAVDLLRSGVDLPM
ncbi:hypothetical protein [Kineococcus sp. NPDC059986]|uniref:hypothetical protein n=1 Tax=Kineococcus sp. NPDC059986 TaxID=3155538 RepID=UPI00344B759F